ncbi:substrate-binding domain-containing protein [Desulfolucanica intricata]|uniref:substrate-binding domain-containing protein n=1 Tax=Desulfolucanica intricata TaxID=1285191 RepID=UPI00082ACD32|nr:helix-turn-helix transcriptional regulator [Desulfolucanica intricata]
MKEVVSLTPKEVADILKITKNTVYELIKRGELPAYRVGRKLRVDPQDVEAYKKQGKRTESVQENCTFPTFGSISIQAKTPGIEETVPEARGLVICGQDVLLDVLTRHLERRFREIHAFRHHVGSFPGLLALYQGKAHMAAIHLWDGATGTYNVPYVRHLLPGIPAVIVHLACRMQGFYVAKGNPKNIANWSDLTRPEITFINREKGSGTRVLLDEKLRLSGIDRHMIKGYQQEEFSHLAVASAVARGEADAALGNEKVSLQVRGIDFIPLQKERYELVIKKEDLDNPKFQAVLDIIQSGEFTSELRGLGDYDLTDTGKISAET